MVEQVQARLTRPEIEFDFQSGGGLSLMERMIGYDRAIIVDALNTGRQPQGTVSSFRLEDLPNYAQSHLASAHETTLQTALQVGRTMGAVLPSDILIVAVEAENVYDFSEELSPAVASAVPRAAELVISQLVN
ncbi:MAG: hydrogenase maturation protease [Anaerolineales bacterium]|nr:hydrogenase maturation protease [Anaerolineales bacterium]